MLKSVSPKTPQHSGHNFTEHIPYTADSFARPLVKAIRKHDWSVLNTKHHIAAHIDHLKFGREDYGYGVGDIAISSRDLMKTPEILSKQQSNPFVSYKLSD